MNKIKVLDISPLGVEVIETQYSVEKFQPCVHTSCDSVQHKLLTINFCTAGLLPKLSNNYPITENRITFDLDSAVKLRDMLGYAICALRIQKYNEKENEKRRKKKRKK